VCRLCPSIFATGEKSTTSVCKTGEKPLKNRPNPRKITFLQRHHFSTRRNSRIVHSEFRHPVTESPLVSWCLGGSGSLRLECQRSSAPNARDRPPLPSPKILREPPRLSNFLRLPLKTQEPVAVGSSAVSAFILPCPRQIRNNQTAFEFHCGWKSRFRPCICSTLQRCRPSSLSSS
jgi:hypothetical protein